MVATILREVLYALVYLHDRHMIHGYGQTPWGSRRASTVPLTHGAAWPRRGRCAAGGGGGTARLAVISAPSTFCSMATAALRSLACTTASISSWTGKRGVRHSSSAATSSGRRPKSLHRHACASARRGRHSAWPADRCETSPPRCMRCDRTMATASRPTCTRLGSPRSSSSTA